MVTTFFIDNTIIRNHKCCLWVKNVKKWKFHRILYKGCQILKMDILKLSNSQKNFPLYKKIKIKIKIKIKNKK